MIYSLAFIGDINKYFTLYLVFPSIVLLGIYLTWKLKFVQVSKLKLSFASLIKKEDKNDAGEGNISHYQAVASVLAGNFGTGNISGMAVALAVGGPGALIWMWVMAFFGSAIQFANCVLGVKYRKKNAEGQYVGGPMYYLSEGLGLKSVAVLFSISVILAALAVGCLVQTNSVALPLAQMGVTPWISGVVMAILVALVTLGGANRVANVCSAVVPVMAILYLGAALFILGTHTDKLAPCLSLVFKSAFGLMPLAGGAVGFTIMKAITTGFDRAIFATDAGTGIVPLLQSGARTKHPVIDGIVSLVAPFLVMIVCTSTALVLMVTGAYGEAGLQSTNMVTHAFREGLGTFGVYVVFIALFLFGYTTTLAYGTCLEGAVGYLFGRRLIRAFQYFYILLVPFGALMRVDIVWIIADVAITSMMIFNLIGVAGLSKEVIVDTRNFFFKKYKARVESAE